jgi:hypothetical protein
MDRAKIILLSLFLTIIGCRNNNTKNETQLRYLDTEVKVVDFNQSLFRECIEFLDEKSAVKIIASDVVSKKSDIVITYNSSERDVFTHVKNLVDIVNKDYSLHWTCKFSKGVIYINHE